jgi:hypothetical protein
MIALSQIESKMIGIDHSHSNDAVLDEFEPRPLQTDFPVSISISASVSV